MKLPTKLPTYPHRLRFAKEGDRPLMPGRNNAKLGNRVTRSHHRGARIWSLTLQERGTSCPPTCQQWDICYGDNMPFATRWAFTPQLVQCIWDQLDHVKMPILVRLHILGDFPSSAYVHEWGSILLHHRQLALYGYTHHPHQGAVGQAVQRLNHAWPDRCVIRFSDQDTTRADLPHQLSAWVEGTPGMPEEGIWCPEQTGDTDSCATCGLCWENPVTTPRPMPIFFKNHSQEALRASRRTTP